MHELQDLGLPTFLLASFFLIFDQPEVKLLLNDLLFFMYIDIDLPIHPHHDSSVDLPLQ